MSFFQPSTSSTLVGANTAAEKDIEVADPPTDSISALAFSPTADYLAVGSWDNNVNALNTCTLDTSSRSPSFGDQVRIYEVGANGQTQGKAMYPHPGPVLSVCWNKVSSQPPSRVLPYA